MMGVKMCSSQRERMTVLQTAGGQGTGGQSHLEPGLYFWIFSRTCLSEFLDSDGRVWVSQVWTDIKGTSKVASCKVSSLSPVSPGLISSHAECSCGFRLKEVNECMTSRLSCPG